MNTTMEVNNERAAVTKIWDHMVRGLNKYCEENGYTFLHNLSLIGKVTNACENIDSLFKLDFYEQQAILSQSNQLAIEPFAQRFGKVACQIQSFRKEAEANGRHLSQFQLYELEVLGTEDDLIGEVNKAIFRAYKEVAFHCREELQCLGRDWKDLLSWDVQYIDYWQAIRVLNKNYGYNLKFGDDLKAEHELALIKHFGYVPVWVRRYATGIKFFNMLELPDYISYDENGNKIVGGVVDSADLLLPSAGEVVGSAQRETYYNKLVPKLENSDMFHRLIQQGLKREDFDEYLEYHKDKKLHLHSGCGIGLARLSQAIIGRPDIRDCVPFLLNADSLKK